MHEMPEEGKCWLTTSHNQCCCVCKNLIVDYHHCKIDDEYFGDKDRCICSDPAGWICICPEIYEGKGGCSGWPQHSLGCEVFERRKGE